MHAYPSGWAYKLHYGATEPDPPRTLDDGTIRRYLENLPPMLSFTSYDDLMETLTPRVLDLIEAIHQEGPSSINEAARVVERDIKNVHEELILRCSECASASDERQFTTPIGKVKN